MAVGSVFLPGSVWGLELGQRSWVLGTTARRVQLRAPSHMEPLLRPCSHVLWGNSVCHEVGTVPFRALRSSLAEWPGLCSGGSCDPKDEIYPELLLLPKKCLQGWAAVSALTHLRTRRVPKLVSLPRLPFVPLPQVWLTSCRPTTPVT